MAIDRDLAAGQERATDEVAEAKEAAQKSADVAASSTEITLLDSLSINDRNTLADPDDVVSQFEDLNLSPELLKGLIVGMKFKKPSKMQAQILPMILNPPYKNLIAQAHNGSGKTACFVIGMLSRVDPKTMAPQALCVCPTRELANQNLEVIRKMGMFTQITTEKALKPHYTDFFPSLKRPPITAQVVVGTPGTVCEAIMREKRLDTSHMKILVFDEAFLLFSGSGFRNESVKIMKAITNINLDCQVLLFSATLHDTVRAFVSKNFVRECNQTYVKNEELLLESVKQYKVHCPDELSKVKVITDQILKLREKVGQTIVFVRNRESAYKLHTDLVNIGYEVSTTHLALNLEDGDRIVKEFKERKTHVLLATDFLARGFDNEQVNLVINYDYPVIHSQPDCDVYLNRVGRAGRFGRKGAVFNLLCDGSDDDQIMSKIERRFNNAQITEVSPWDGEKEFRVALESAGLLGVCQGCNCSFGKVNELKNEDGDGLDAEQWEVSPWDSEKEFRVALESAGLLC